MIPLLCRLHLHAFRERDLLTGCVGIPRLGRGVLWGRARVVIPMRVVVECARCGERGERGKDRLQ